MSYKLDFYKKQFPDAVQYLDKSQSFVSENEARKVAYNGKDRPAKCLYQDIREGSKATLQQYIFSEQALAEDLKAAERKEVHDEQLMQPYH